MSAAVDTTVDDGSAAAIDFCAGAWSRGGHLEPPVELLNATDRNRWRVVEGATREAVSILDPAAPDREPGAPRVTSEALVVIVARALVVGEQRFGYSIADASAALQLAQSIVDEAVRRLERDSLGAGLNGHAKREEEQRADGDGDTAVTRPRFHFIIDRALEAQPAGEWLVDDVLFRKSLGVVPGPPAAFKSFIGIDLCSSVQTGTPFANRATRCVASAYVLAEGRGQFGRRTRAWRQYHGLAEPIGVHFLPEPVQFMDHGETTELLHALDALPKMPGLLVIDTMARCLVGGDENSANDVGLFIAGVDRVREHTGATVLVIHHTNLTGQRERGSTALRGAADTVMLAAADGAFVTLTCDKQKDAEQFAPMTFRKRIVELDDGSTSCVLVPVDIDDEQRRPSGLGDLPKSVRAILEALHTTFPGGAPATKILQATGLKDRTFFDGLKRGRAWGFIEGATGNKGNRLTFQGSALFQ